MFEYSFLLHALCFANAWVDTIFRKFTTGFMVVVIVVVFRAPYPAFIHPIILMVTQFSVRFILESHSNYYESI